MASRTLDPSKAWDNPNMKIPIEKAHLQRTKGDNENPQLYEQLCDKHDTIEKSERQDGSSSVPKQLDSSMLEFLFEKPTHHWDAVSLQFMT